jgi:hypothetical protein
MKNKVLFLIVIIAGLFLFSVKNSSAQALSYQVVNNTGVTLANLYVTPAETTHWGNDILPNHMFENC